MATTAKVDFEVPVLVLGPQPREPYVHTYGKIIGLSPVVARLALSSTAGPVRITVDTLDVDPGIPALDDWETIEEGTIESIVAGLPPLRLTGERVHEFGFLERLPIGLYRIRASVIKPSLKLSSRSGPSRNSSRLTSSSQATRSKYATSTATTGTSRSPHDQEAYSRKRLRASTLTA